MDQPHATTVYIKLIRKEKDIVGHAVSNTKNFESPPEDESPQETLSEATSIEPQFSGHLDSFVDSMIVYLDFMPMILTASHSLSRGMLIASMEALLNKNSISKEEVPDGTIYELPRSHYSDFIKLTDNLEPTFDVLSSLSRTVLMGLIALLDHHIRDVMRLAILSNPSVTESGNETLTVREIMSFNDFEQLRKHLAQAEIDRLSRGGRDQQIEWFEKKYAIKSVSKNYEHWSSLMEICERRNLFAHTNGFVSQQYLTNGEKYGYNIKDLAVGAKLGVDPKYYSDSVKCIFEFGVMLTHVVRKKLLGKKDTRADAQLSHLGYRLILRGDYQLARRILHFAFHVRDIETDEIRKMIAVNYANALKLCKKSDEAIKVLDSIDWTSSRVDFEICVSAVKGDVARVVDLMRQMGANGRVQESDFREWPVFFHVRENEEFRKAYEEIFRLPYKPSPKKRDAFSEMVKHMPGKKSRKQTEGEDGTLH